MTARTRAGRRLLVEPSMTGITGPAMTGWQERAELFAQRRAEQRKAVARCAG